MKIKNRVLRPVRGTSWKWNQQHWEILIKNIKIDEDGNWEIPNFEAPDLVYSDTMEEAL